MTKELKLINVLAIIVLLFMMYNVYSQYQLNKRYEELVERKFTVLNELETFVTELVEHKLSNNE